MLYESSELEKTGAADTGLKTTSTNHDDPVIKSLMSSASELGC